MKRSIVKEVEQEFGQPFWEVVRGFAADNYGCDTTARILGYSSPKGLRELIARHGVTIDWPKHGSCNMQQDRGSYDRSRIDKAVSTRLSNSKTPAYFYEQRTGESVEKLIERVCQTHTLTEVYRMVGWNSLNCFRSWMDKRGIKATFKKVKPAPPKGGGWQSDRCKAVSNASYINHLARCESAHHAAQNTL